MRPTLRDPSVRRKPVRTASTNHPSTARNDSLSPARGRTPSRNANDAGSAAKAAQLRLPTIPTPIYDSLHSYREDDIDLQQQQQSSATVHAQSDMLRRATTGQRSRGNRSEGTHPSYSPPRPTTTTIPKRPKSTASKLKTGCTKLLGGYMDMFHSRAHYASDEHLGMRMLLDSIAQRKRRVKNKTKPHAAIDIERFQARRYKEQHASDPVAWPTAGVPQAMSRAPTPPQVLEQTENEAVRPRGRAAAPRAESRLTNHTRITQWGDIQAAVSRSDGGRQDATGPSTRSRFSKMMLRAPGRGTAKHSNETKIDAKKSKSGNLTIRTNNLPYSSSRPKPLLTQAPANTVAVTVPTQSHTLDPNPSRHSWMTDDFNGYKTHTDASSIYSRPGDEARFPATPPPMPAMPAAYARAYSPVSRPVSPLESGVSAFLLPRREETPAPRYGGAVSEYDRVRGKYEFEDDDDE